MKPFLKWAGNKYQIIDIVKDVICTDKDTLIEPFVGSASIFLNTDFKNYVLADINPDIINLYKLLQEDGKSFVAKAKRYFTEEYNTEAKYYELRELFNSTSNIELKSILFIYLNRHCFNGLCRYNKSGKFNVPYGKYKKPYFPEKELNYFVDKLNKNKVIFVCCSFEELFKKYNSKNAIWYLDPPYVPLTITANFASYTSDSFGNKEHELLTKLTEKKSKICKIVISNHDTKYSRKLYKNANKIIELEVNRFISANGNRDKAKELIAIFGE